MNDDPPDYPAEFKNNPHVKRLLASRKRLFRGIGMGVLRIVKDVLALGGDPNATDKHGRPALVRAVRGRVVESSVVQALLDAGADPSATDDEGLTALDRARRRLLKYEGKPRNPPRRSPSLTAGGEVILHDFEIEALEEMYHTHPDLAEEFEQDYLEERRRVAERVYDTRGNLERIVEMLETRARR
jgi:hypothetical protein